MNHELLGLAFAAGLVAALNPCGFALLPAYLTFVISDSSPGRPAAVARAAAATVAMTLGFLTVFAVFGALTPPVAAAVQRYLPRSPLWWASRWWRSACGCWPATGCGCPLRRPSDGPRQRGWGRCSATAWPTPWRPCPARSARFWPSPQPAREAVRPPGAVAVYLAYAAGFALIVGTFAVAAAFACSALARGCAGCCRWSIASAVHW